MILFWLSWTDCALWQAQPVASCEFVLCCTGFVIISDTVQDWVVCMLLHFVCLHISWIQSCWVVEELRGCILTLNTRSFRGISIIWKAQRCASIVIFFFLMTEVLITVTVPCKPQKRTITDRTEVFPGRQLQQGGRKWCDAFSFRKWTLGNGHNGRSALTSEYPSSYRWHDYNFIHHPALILQHFD